MTNDDMIPLSDLSPGDLFVQYGRRYLVMVVTDNRLYAIVPEAGTDCSFAYPHLIPRSSVIFRESQGKPKPHWIDDPSTKGHHMNGGNASYAGD